MNILLISANTERINLPTYPLGLACVAQAALDQGHDVMGLDLMAEKDWEAAGILADHGIQTMGFLMLGGPGETRDTVEESLAFVGALNLDALKITLGIRIYSYTKLAELAVQEGLIAPDDDLLFPKFYMVKGLEGWLREAVAKEVRKHPNWVM